MLPLRLNHPSVVRHSSTMIPSLSYHVLDVFTATPFAGNPLAVVHLPELPQVLTQPQKQLIAREFGYSETVFVHPPPSRDNTSIITIDIFGTDHEITFGGHPAVGAGLHLLNQYPSPLTLQTKAGLVPIAEEDGIVTVQVPIDIKHHEPHPLPHLRTQQPSLSDADFVIANGTGFPLVSIVKGMTFVLLELKSTEALTKMNPYSAPAPLPEGYLGEWAGMVGVYAYVIEESSESAVKIRTRMFYGEGQEDAASGSAGCALGAWWATASELVPTARNFSFAQGDEIGRRSDMEVRVTTDDQGAVTGVAIGGEAVEVMKGRVKAAF